MSTPQEQSNSEDVTVGSSSVNERFAKQAETSSPSSINAARTETAAQMPKPKYSGQEFSAWKQYMGTEERPDEKFIVWKKGEEKEEEKTPPKPKYSGQEFSAWKEYMGTGEEADKEFIEWKKDMLKK